MTTPTTRPARTRNRPRRSLHTLTAAERPYELLGRLLQAFLHARGWSQKELARRMGCQQSNISQLQNAKRGRSLHRWAAVAQAFGLTLSEFLAAAEARRRPTGLVDAWDKPIFTDDQHVEPTTVEDALWLAAHCTHPRLDARWRSVLNMRAASGFAPPSHEEYVAWREAEGNRIHSEAFERWGDMRDLLNDFRDLDVIYYGRD